MVKNVEVRRRMAIPRVPINMQDPDERRKNWDEVFLGFDLESAKVEAMRAAHATLPMPERAGRSIGIRRKTA